MGENFSHDIGKTSNAQVLFKIAFQIMQEFYQRVFHVCMEFVFSTFSSILPLSACQPSAVLFTMQNRLPKFFLTSEGVPVSQ